MPNDEHVILLRRGAGAWNSWRHEPNVSAPPFPHYGLEHIGLTVDDVDAAVEELRAKGAEIAIGPLTATRICDLPSSAVRKES